MSERPIHHQFRVDLEIAGTPEAVWEAISTATGISAWMMPAEIDARPGGRVVFHMGPDEDSTGEVTAVEPKRRFAYQEDWAGLAGEAGADVTPLVTEFLIEARSGGTCSVRITSSAFGSGADWENEFFGEMEAGWAPIDNLRLYVEHYPGRQSTNMWLSTDAPASAETAIDAVRRRLGVAVGDRTTLREVEVVLQRSVGRHLLLVATAPIEGFLSFFAWGEADACALTLTGQLFGDRAAAYVDAEQTGWQGWIDEVAASLASTSQ